MIARGWLRSVTVRMVLMLSVAALIGSSAMGGSLANAAEVPESLRRLESAAAGCNSAAAAARIYTVALTSGSLQGSARQAAEARREHWLKLADEGRRRIGREWFDAKERKKLEAEADLFIEQSF